MSEAEAYEYQEDQLLDRRDPVVQELFIHPDRYENYLFLLPLNIKIDI